MPIYEYQCRRCGHRLEAMQRLSDAPLRRCPECGGGLKKLISAPAFQFKGSGWYVTDYARTQAAETKGDGAAEAKGEGVKGEPKGKGDAAGGEAADSSAGAPAKTAKGSKRAAPSAPGSG